MNSQTDRLSLEQYCIKCVYFENSDGVCRWFSKNVVEYPNTLRKKCRGSFYESDPQKREDDIEIGRRTIHAKRDRIARSTEHIQKSKLAETGKRLKTAGEQFSNTLLNVDQQLPREEIGVKGWLLVFVLSLVALPSAFAVKLYYLIQFYAPFWLQVPGVFTFRLFDCLIEGYLSYLGLRLAYRIYFRKLASLQQVTTWLLLYLSLNILRVVFAGAAEQATAGLFLPEAASRTFEAIIVVSFWLLYFSRSKKAQRALLGQKEFEDHEV